MKKLIVGAAMMLFVCSSCAKSVEKDYSFEGSISKEVLMNYLSRAVTFNGLSMSDSYEDDLRIIRELKPKYVGRVSYVWNNYTDFPGRVGGAVTDPNEIFANAKKAVDDLHQIDSQIIAQACLFEIVDSSYVEKIAIPEYVLEEFNQPTQKRNFRYGDMIYQNKLFYNRWGMGQSVPDLSRVETQMFWYFLATNYINMGYESLHCGQIQLMNVNQGGDDRIFDMLNSLREYAKDHGRRGLVLFDAHTHGIVSEQGNLLFDFHSFPMRPKEVIGKPYECILEVGYDSSIYQKSQGGVAPSGWECESLPYIVELDNSGTDWDYQGRSDNPTEIWPWGWEEINWFSHCSPTYRAEWLKYAVSWLKETDPVGFVQMPLKIPTENRYPNGLRVWYRANTLSTQCPMGFSDEQAIREAWALIE